MYRWPWRKWIRPVWITVNDSVFPLLEAGYGILAGKVRKETRQEREKGKRGKERMHLERQKRGRKLEGEDRPRRTRSRWKRPKGGRRPSWNPYKLGPDRCTYIPTRVLRYARIILLYIENQPNAQIHIPVQRIDIHSRSKVLEYLLFEEICIRITQCSRAFDIINTRNTKWSKWPIENFCLGNLLI